ADNCTKMILLLLSLLHIPEAPVITTLEGPVTWKSLPSGAMVLQRINFEKTSCKILGEHPTGVRLSIGVGCIGEIAKGIFSPGTIGVLQLSSKVFPSVPFFAIN